MTKSLILFFLPIAFGLECVFHTDPIHPVNPKFQDKNSTGVKEYTCNGDDKYCAYFEGHLMTASGTNQTFAVRSCESDLMHYVGPIGETIGHKISANCKEEGPVQKTVGALTYFINCCKEPDCDIIQKNGATDFKFNWFLSISAFLIAIPFYA